MPTPFSDITLYLDTGAVAGTPAFVDETGIINYISDLYCQCMNGYKPPGCSRVTIQPYYHTIWNRTWKNGSIIAIAPAFDPDNYRRLDKMGKYHLLLNLIQHCLLQLSDEYTWNRTVFESAYAQVLDSKFVFDRSYAPVLSKNRKMKAFQRIEKTESITSVFINIDDGTTLRTIKLYEKKNNFWYDCAYILARHTKWFDADRVGIFYPKCNLSIWYSLSDNEVQYFKDDVRVDRINFSSCFFMQVE